MSVLGAVTTDFLARMESAAYELDDIANRVLVTPGDRHSHIERARLRGKAEGVRLAMSYWRDAERFAPSPDDAIDVAVSEGLIAWDGALVESPSFANSAQDPTGHAGASSATSEEVGQ